MQRTRSVNGVQSGGEAGPPRIRLSASGGVGDQGDRFLTGGSLTGLAESVTGVIPEVRLLDDPAPRSWRGARGEHRAVEPLGAPEAVLVDERRCRGGVEPRAFGEDAALVARVLVPAREVGVPRRQGDAGAERGIGRDEDPVRVVAPPLADLFDLGVADVRTDADFFELGGHSLLATQLLARVQETVPVQLPLETIFTAPTIAQLAAVIEERLLEVIEDLPESEAQRLVAALAR